MPARFAGDHPVIEPDAAVTVSIGSGRAQLPTPTTLRREMRTRDQRDAVGVSPTARVRTTCRRVAERGRYVSIDDDLLAAYARSLPLSDLSKPSFDPDHHYLGHGDATVAFVVTLDSINFGSGYFPALRKRPGLSGYFTIASSLNDFFNEQGPLSARQLREISSERCRSLFGQEPSDPTVVELMALFAKALNDLGGYLHERFDDSFTKLVLAADGSVDRLIVILEEMPLFRDVETYEGADVAFYKRAQLMTADLALALEGSGPGRFDDLSKLTMFADNLVPHVLRVDGVLRYDPALLEQINTGELIAPSSKQEVEIRACAVYAVERIAEELRRTGRAVTAMELDYFLWNRGQQAEYKARPRHRTRTVFY